MNRFARSWELARESWGVLRRTPSLVVFPLVSGIATFILTLSFFIPLYVVTQGKDIEKVNPAIGYPLLALFYLASYFIVIFFNSGLVAAAYDSLNGRPTSFGEGFNHAVRRLPAIFGWALVAATVGMILRLLSERAGIIGKIVVALLGAAWNLITYFVVPIIVVEQGSPIQALKKSGGMLKTTWGENLIGNAGIGMAIGLLCLPPFIPLFLAMLSGSLPLILIVVGLSVLYWLALAVISASMHGVYQTALYVYATTGSVPAGFSNDYIAGAFTTRPGIASKLGNWGSWGR